MSIDNRLKKIFVPVLMFAPFIGLFYYGVIITGEDREKRLEFGEFTVGRIERVYNLPKRGTFIMFTFKVSGDKFESHTPIDTTVQVGRCFEVQFFPEDPINCEIFLDRPLVCP